MEITKKKSVVNVDLLHGSIFKSLIIFAIPLLISRIFQQLYNTADTMIVGHFLGDTSLAAIGCCSAIYDLFVEFAMGIGNGLAIVTARAFGMGDRNLIKKSVATGLVIGAASSLIITIVGCMVLKPLLQVLNTPAEIIDEAYKYIFIITLFIIVMFAYNLFTGLLRAIGNSVVPLIFLVFSSVLNVFLDWWFVTAFSMGIESVAYATVISQFVSVILCVLYLLKKADILIPQKADFKVNSRLYKEMLAQGLSMGIMSCIVSLGSVILQSGINKLGYLVIAAHTTARKLFMIFCTLFTSLNLAMSTFVSQNYGADNRKRIIDSLKTSYILDFIMAAVITVIMIFFADDLCRLVSGSSEYVVIHYSTLYMQVCGPFYFILGVLGQARFSLQGMGDKIMPVVSSVIELVGKVIFVIFLIPRFAYMAVIFCEPIIWCFMAAQTVFCYCRNPYIRKGIRKTII